MTRVRPAGVFEATIAWDATPHDLAYRLRVHEGDAVHELVDPYQFGPVLTDFDLHLFAEGTHYRAWEQLGARRLTIGDVTGVHFAVWAPNAQRVSVVGDFNHWDGRVHPMRRLMPSGIWELFVPGLGNGARYKYEVRTPEGHLLEKADPFARAAEAPPRTASLVWTEDDYAWNDHGLDVGTRLGGRVAGSADVDLRSAPGLVAPARRRQLPVLPRAGGHAGSVCLGHGLHARGADARHGAPLRRLLGLPGGRLLRANRPIRHARRLPLLRGSLPSAGSRRDPRLGARPLPEGSARARALRRHGALRARGSAARRAPRVGHAGLQLRARRGADLPAQQRAVLAGVCFTPTGCAWTPWRRCCIWTTRARKGSGCRTSTAGARTWRPWSS